VQSQQELTETLVWEGFLARLDRVLITPCDCGRCDCEHCS
jgi:hypothetical protein